MKTKNLFIVFSLLLFSVSCNKDWPSNVAQHIHKEYSSLDEFYEHNGAPEQSFTIDAIIGATITGEKGVQVTFPPNAFVHQDESAVTGNVTIILKEVLDVKTMILSHMHSMYYEWPMTSGGEIYVMAYQGSEELMFADGKQYTSKIPTDNPDNNMGPFIGVPDTSGKVIWVSADSGFVFNNQPYAASLIAQAQQYFLSTNWLGWVNCDYPYFGNSYFTVVGDPTDDPDEIYIDVNMVFEGTVIHLYQDFGNDNFPYLYAPDGYNGTLVSLGIKNKQLVSAFVPFTVSGTQSVSFTLQETTTEEFEAALDELN